MVSWHHEEPIVPNATAGGILMKKRPLTLCTILLLMMISTAAMTASLSVTLDAATPVGEQARALTAYICELPPAQQEEWLEEISAFLTSQKTFFAQPATDREETIDYVTDKGQRYHSQTTCSGLKKAINISGVTKEVALAMGRTPCKICCPGGD